MKAKYLTSLLILLGCLCLYGFEWQTYTNANFITSLSSKGMEVWAASTGGALRFDLINGNVFKFTNTHGVGGNDLHACAYCNHMFWFGSSDGKLSRFDSESNEWKQFLFIDRDGLPLRINHLLCDGNYLWVSSNIGISLFDTERYGGEIKETYRRFGDIPAGTEVNAAIIVNDTVWLATSNGIAYAHGYDRNLLDFTHWNSLNRDSLPALSSNDIKGVVSYENRIWVRTREAAFELLYDSGYVVGRVIGPPQDIYSSAVLNDTLYLGCASGLLYTCYDGRLDNIEIAGIDSAITAIEINPDLGMVVGSMGQGAFFQKNGAWTNMTTQGPARNQVVDMAETGDGRIWFVHDRGYISVFDGDAWESLPITKGLMASIQSDKDDNVWVGTFGAGVSKITPDLQVTVYDTSNSSLMGVKEGLHFIVVSDIHYDPEEILWFACYRGYPTRPISLYNPSLDEWAFYYFGADAGDAKILALYSNGAELWTGFEDNGVFRVNYGDDPFNTSDLSFKHYTRTQAALPSDNVGVISADNDGRIWVGTDMGLAYFDDGINRFIRTLLPEGVGPQINDILFDLRNSIWAATQSGLAFREVGETEFSAFTTANSDIVANAINSILFDSQRRLWIATDFGVSVLTYDIGAVTENVDQVFAYPNPFILSENEKVFFNYAGQVPVDIFSLNGRRIKTIMSNIGWDGTNENGEKVASGLYLFFIRDSLGNSHAGKIGVVRK